MNLINIFIFLTIPIRLFYVISGLTLIRDGRIFSALLSGLTMGVYVFFFNSNYWYDYVLYNKPTKWYRFGHGWIYSIVVAYVCSLPVFFLSDLQVEEVTGWYTFAVILSFIEKLSIGFYIRYVPRFVYMCMFFCFQGLVFYIAFSQKQNKDKSIILTGIIGILIIYEAITRIYRNDSVGE